VDIGIASITGALGKVVCTLKVSSFKEISMRKPAVLAAGIAFAGSLALAFGTSVAPAAADAGSSLTFWSGDFAGQTVTYAAPNASCANLPFTAHAELDNTSEAILVYEGANCTGAALVFPAEDIHSFPDFDGFSYRVDPGYTA
jgi:hypothetical protein